MMTRATLRLLWVTALVGGGIGCSEFADTNREISDISQSVADASISSEVARQLEKRGARGLVNRNIGTTSLNLLQGR